MAEGRWSQARREKKKLRQQMLAEFEREFLDEEERDNGKSK